MAKEFREMSETDLNQKLETVRKELVELRFQRANQQLKNPIKIREARRDIARIHTVLSEKKRSGANEKTK